MTSEISKLAQSKQKYKRQAEQLNENLISVEHVQSIKLENTYLLKKVNTLER